MWGEKTIGRDKEDYLDGEHGAIQTMVRKMKERLELVEVLCQQCNKNKVLIEKHSEYYGILCSKCRSPTTYKENKWIGGKNGTKPNNREEV